MPPRKSRIFKNRLFVTIVIRFVSVNAHRAEISRNLFYFHVLFYNLNLRNKSLLSVSENKNTS